MAAPTPRWLAELSLSLSSNPQVVLSGNVRDYHVLDTDEPVAKERIDTVEAIAIEFGRRGIHTLFVFDPVNGLSLRHRSEDQDKLRTLLNDLPGGKGKDAVSALIGGGQVQRAQPETVKPMLGTLMRAVSKSQKLACALVLDYASWLSLGTERGLSGSDSGTEAPDALRRASELSATADPWRIGRPVGLYNPIIWIVRQPAELPTWLSGSPGMRIISIERPGQDVRQAYGRLVLGRWDEFCALPEAERTRAENLLVDVTEGMTLRESRAIVNLAMDQGLQPSGLAAAQFAYRVGVTESQWEKAELRRNIRSDQAVKKLQGVVDGQHAAIAKAAEIIQRAALGLAGAESSSTNASRPKGVLFFAGPTGVGKTLLAKAIALLVFGQAESYVRFDMSEYSQEHAEARLVGAPPGYVGYTAGGQLTEAVRQRPFSLLLFDEIEKAHPLILDKFLQILDEGRLTDGSGTTVNFSETIIVFTSNLGVTEIIRDEQGNPRVVERVKYADRFPAVGVEGISYAELEETVRDAVREHFVTGIRRPELFNRIGQGNVIAFDFIDRDPTALKILHRAVANVVSVVKKKHGVTLQLTLGAEKDLAKLALSDRTLRMGGRGINSTVEEFLVNPLARKLAESLDETGSFTFAPDGLVQLGFTKPVPPWAVTLDGH